MEELLFLVALAGETLNKLTTETCGGFEIRNHIIKKYHGQSEVVIIPKQIRGIAPDAFSRCSHVISVKIPEYVEYIGNHAFFGCKNLEEVTLPKGITLIDFMTFYKCSSLKSITIPEGVTSIGDSAFSDCTNLADAVIPESVEIIGKMAFWCCESLTQITIPNSVTSIGNGTFFKCKNLKTITLSKNLKNIAKSLFDGCESLTSLIIPEGVTNIGDMAFFCCKSLQNLYIPESVVSIGKDVFYKCTSLKHVQYGKIQLNLKHHVTIDAQIQFICEKDYSVQMESEVKDDILTQMYILNMDAERIYSLFRGRSIQWINFIIQKNYIKAIEKILTSGEFITKQNIDNFILYAIEQQKYEIQVLLMDYKTKRHWYDDMQTTIQKKFNL